MCGYKTLHNNEDGYVVACHCCGHIQVAFGTTAMSFTREQFYDHIRLVDECYKVHCLTAFRDQKNVTIPTVARSLSLIYSVNELKRLLKLMINGRNKLEHDKLFRFHDN
ncbi:MAG: hypothetical protein JNL72_09785 [Flavipsychrobacter sp.]|nr:hypothetical protein [Flavipsychrobacter sp.]